MTGARLKEVLEDVADNLFNPDPYYQQGGDMVRCGGRGVRPRPRAPRSGRAGRHRRASERSGSHDRRWRATRPASTGSAPGGTGRRGSGRARRPGPPAASAPACGRRPVPPSGRGATGTTDRPRPGRARRSSTAYHPISTSDDGHHRAAEGRRQRLPAEADPEHRYAGRVRLAEEGELGDDPRCRSGRRS